MEGLVRKQADEVEVSDDGPCFWVWRVSNWIGSVEGQCEMQIVDGARRAQLSFAQVLHRWRLLMAGLFG
ncbi:uncharacterized protein G2W53_000685 [Senna tora]|uniref:Uncharacterized protein n=1 Tax=Senna tora TaxID=362788 RepID=A0A835CKT9_9FABA|nr:uncharacterized protein G2W53_000685 [Senna tora]